MKFKLFILFSLVVIAIGLAGCGGTDSNGDPINRTSFLVNGGPKHQSYTSDIGFVHIGLPPSVSYTQDKNDITHNYLSIQVPTDVGPGKTYTQNDSSIGGFYVVYYNANGVRYQLDSTGTFSLKVTDWAGAGSVAKGNFSGTLVNESVLGDSVQITDGTFQAFIHNN
jgi:hypothetical protein